MFTDVHSEWNSWREALRIRRWTLLFLSGIIVVMVSLFLALVWEYQLLSGQVAQLTTQVEVIAEVDSALLTDQVQIIQTEIEHMPMVTRVDFWPSERSAQYINDTILSGYLDFLKKTELQVPVNPLFRIQLTDLDQKQALEKTLSEKYGDKLILIDSGTSTDHESFANQFVRNVSESVRTLQWLMILQLVIVITLFGYLTRLLIVERRGGFHLAQFLHLSPSYLFTPAWLLTSGIAFFVILPAVILSALIVGHGLILLALALWGVILLMNAVICFAGRRG